MIFCKVNKRTYNNRKEAKEDLGLYLFKKYLKHNLFVFELEKINLDEIPKIEKISL